MLVYLKRTYTEDPISEVARKIKILKTITLASLFVYPVEHAKCISTRRKK